MRIQTTISYDIQITNDISVLKIRSYESKLPIVVGIYANVICLQLSLKWSDSIDLITSPSCVEACLYH